VHVSALLWVGGQVRQLSVGRVLNVAGMNKNGTFAATTIQLGAPPSFGFFVSQLSFDKSGRVLYVVSKVCRL
jgi:hypothetical protein